MRMSSRMFAILGIAVVLIGTGMAQAQIVAPPVPSIIPPPPPPSAPPPPSMEVPAVPKLDAPAPRAKSEPRRSSFNDRVTGCLDDAYAARLAPGDRVAYSRSCANRVE